MSVYTPVTRSQLERFLEQYALGPLLDYQGISAGIENTNFFVTTATGEFVLTLFEQLAAEELPYFLELTAYLAEHAVPCAHPLADRQGRYLHELNGKPAALVNRLCGREAAVPTQAQCSALGTALGRMHAAAMRFPRQRANARGPHWWRVTAARVLPHLPAEAARLLETEIARQTAHRHDNLPRGVIHADLFRDNALFEGEHLCGIIDFYYACNDVLLYDVAITVNDWCSLPDGELNPAQLLPLLHAYAAERPFSVQEQAVWPLMLRAAALRFWLSRLQDWHFPRPGELTHRKDPAVFQRILQCRHRLPADIAQLPGIAAHA